MNYLSRYLEPMRGEPDAEGGGTPEPEVTEVAETTEPEPEEDEDYEYDGESYKLPKKLAAHVKTAAKEAAENGNRERDYRFKTGEIATERKAYQDRLKEVSATLEAYKPRAPDPAMLDPASEKYDRDTYYRDRDAHDAWKVKADAVKSAQAEEDGKNKTEAERAKAASFAKENTALLKAIPEWKDPEKRAAEVVKIGKHAESLGVTPEEWAELSDHRLLLALRGDMLYRASLKKAAPAPVVAADAPKPAPLQVRKIGNGTTPPEKLSDRMSTDNWMEQRKKQLSGARR